jgi:hypothetical protein
MPRQSETLLDLRIDYFPTLAAVLQRSSQVFIALHADCHAPDSKGNLGGHAPIWSKFPGKGNSVDSI